MTAQNADYFAEYALDKVEVILLIFFLSLHLNISPFINIRVFYGSVLACLKILVLFWFLLQFV